MAFELTVDDHTAGIIFQRRQAFNDLRPQRPSWLTCVCLAVAIACCVLAFSLQTVLILAGVTAVVLVGLVYWLGRLRLRREVARLAADPNADMLGRREVALSPEGVTVTTANGATETTAWADVTTFTRTDRHLFLRGRFSQLVMVPQRAFDSVGDAVSFAATIDGYLQHAVQREGREQAATSPFLTAALGHDAAATSAILPYAERIRGQRLEDESRLKRSTLLLTAPFVVASALGIVVFESAWAKAPWESTVYLVAMTVAAVGGCIVSWGVFRMAAWSRQPLIALASFGLLLIPFGTVFGFRILRRVCSGDAPRLLSQEYEWLVRQTRSLRSPHARGLRPFTWFVLILIVLIAGLAVLIAQLPPELRQAR